MNNAEGINISGKDYLTQKEAAHYCGMSLQQFRKIAPGHGIRPASFGGKLLYRRTDLQRAIEGVWHHSEKRTGRGFSTITKMDNVKEKH